MDNKLKEIVFQALGKASMQWEPRPTGVFDSTGCAKIGDKLLADIEQQKKCAHTPADEPPQIKHELVAVHAGGEGWGLSVEVNGDSVAEIPWPNNWPEIVNGDWMREHGFKVVHA